MRKYTATEKQNMMTTLLASSAGRKRLAASLIQPLRSLRDYSSIGRRAFMVDELPEGALPIYDKDVDVPAYVVAEEGDSIETRVKGTRILVPLFELASYPTIPFTQVKERRFDIIARVKQKAKDELFREEDRRIFAVMKAACEDNAENPTVTTSALKIDNLADAFAEIEKHGLVVDKIFMNGFNTKVLRTAGRDIMDFETQRELLKTGYIGTLWGAAIYQSPEVAKDEIYVTAAPEYTGVIAERIALTVLPADDAAKRLYGWSIFEQLGIACHNPKAICKVKISG